MLSTRRLVGTAVLIGLLFAFDFATSSDAFAAEKFQTAPMIFDVRINLPLEPTEPTYHDFYINAGPEAGFKRGMFVTVVRPVPVHDPVQNKQQGTLNVGVARLQVIHVERTITVARLHSEFGNDERPTLEYEAVMIGDRIDPDSLTMDAPDQKKKKGRSAATLKIIPEAEAAQPQTQAQPAAALPPAPQPAQEEQPVQIPVPMPLKPAPAPSSVKSTAIGPKKPFLPVVPPDMVRGHVDESERRIEAIIETAAAS